MTIKYYLTCIFLCATCITRSQEAAMLNSRGDSLLAGGYYLEASVQYERVLFTAEDPAEVYHAILFKIQCLKQQRQFKEAVRFINANLRNDLNDSLGYALHYEQTLCHYLAGSYENCLAAIEQVKLDFPLRAADISLDALQILSLNEQRKWSEAAPVYATLVRKLGTDTALSDPYLHIPSLKSVDKAGWLATFIPGGGQFYAGKPLEGMISILIQGAGIFYGVWSFREKYYLSAWLAGAGIFGSFHMGGVRRSETLVNQYNEKKSTVFNNQVRKEIIQLLR